MGEILKNLKSVDWMYKMFDVIRVVNPVSAKICEVHGNIREETGLDCYGFWQKNTMCDNCISICAYYQEESFFKIETRAGKGIYLVMAVPVHFRGQKLVVEFIKEGETALFCINGLDEDVYLKMIKNMQMATIKDELTCLYNRRFLNQCLPIDIHKSFLQNKPISIIYADIDCFKNVNDSYGHSAGDDVLCEFALLINKHLDESKDWAVRCGGDEFIICLPGTDYANAKITAENIRCSLQNHAFDVSDEQRLHLTASFGVHTVENNLQEITVDSIIHIADTKMYEAKKSRNTVV